MEAPPTLRAPLVPLALLATPRARVVVLDSNGEVYLPCTVLEALVGGDVMSHNEAMSILRRAEGYCLNKALSSQGYEGVRDYLDAANWLNYLWREMWQGRSMLRVPPMPSKGHSGGSYGLY